MRPWLSKFPICTALTPTVEACAALPDFKPTIRGGDGNGVQFCGYFWPFYVPQITVLIFALDFVGHWPASNTVIVSHQGTDPTQLSVKQFRPPRRLAHKRNRLSLLTDLDFIPVALDPKQFPGIPDTVKVHEGFRAAHYDTATAILNETQRIIAEKGSKQVVLVRPLPPPRAPLPLMWARRSGTRSAARSQSSTH